MNTIKKIDFHVHIANLIPLEQTVYNYRDMCQRYGLEGVFLQALVTGGASPHPTCNEDALRLKELMPGSYAFAALHHDRDFVEQTKEFVRLGFDGIKLLEGKPSVYRHYGYSFENPRFEEFFTYAEENKIPLLIHNNDPEHFWDISKATQRAIDMGWVYDEKIPSHQWFFENIEGVLKRHRNLRVALAHMGFYSKSLDRAERLMEMCPNLYMDMTPAMDILEEMSLDPTRTESFFRKYHNRIIFGTDADNDLTGERRAYNDDKRMALETFLEGTEPRKIRERLIVPIKLEHHMLKNIYYNNALRFVAK